MSCKLIHFINQLIQLTSGRLVEAGVNVLPYLFAPHTTGMSEVHCCTVSTEFERNRELCRPGVQALRACCCGLVLDQGGGGVYMRQAAHGTTTMQIARGTTTACVPLTGVEL